jgi:natural product precursor
MKTKKKNKKLFLTKQTIANLSSNEMGKVRGGLDASTNVSTDV